VLVIPETTDAWGVFERSHDTRIALLKRGRRGYVGELVGGD